jgi:hypothetical protein
MVTESIIGPMVVFIQAFILKEKETGKAKWSTKMGKYMKEIGKMVRNMVTVNTSQVNKNSLANGIEAS